MDKVKQLYGRPWNEREYIVALHYYFTHREAPRHETADYILELANTLGRTPSAIVMRMENFGSLDSETNHARKGLANLGPLCRKVFSEWKDRQETLKACAEVLIRDAGASETMSLFEPETVTMPKAFGRYELLDRIGEGGSGTVFSCVDVSSRKNYAIKIIRADNRFDRETVHRFSREMRILASTEHPHVIKLHERNLDTEDSFPAFVMDLAEPSLSQHLQAAMDIYGETRPCLSLEERVTIFRSILQGVEALHAAGVIHRDINPNNVLRLPGGEWVLSDFGLAKYLLSAASATTFITNTHAGWGTAYYAAPEQYRDFKRTDERSDIYALGILLWELFSHAWPPPDLRHSGMPENLAQIFETAIQRDPLSRYQTTSEMLGAFDTAVQSSGEQSQ